MRFFLFALFAISLIAHAQSSPRPQVPIMGWSSWNEFRIHIDDGFFGGRVFPVRGCGNHGGQVHHNTLFTSQAI